MVAKVKDEMLGMTASSSPTQELKKGPWKPEEDMLLIEYVKKHGERDWNMVRKHSGLARCGKSCRLRWNNHLRPNLRKGPFSPEEERLICELHSKMGNKWARIAAMLPGRTDNEIKNFWNTRVKRLARKGVPLYPLDIQCPRPDLLNPYLHHIDGQNNNLSSSSPPSTSSSSTLQSHFQTQISPTSHSLLFPPPSSPSQQFSHYDVVLQNSMALYDAALENSRQQQRQQMFASTMMNDNNNNTTTSLFHKFKRHRSVPNLTISVPPVRHVALHPFSPLGISSPLGQSVSMANTPTMSYMQVTPMPSPHSYTSSPIGMVVSPTALQLGISQMSSSQPSFRFPVSSSPPVMNNNNTRPTCLPRTTSFLFDHMLFDLNPTQEQSNQMQATDNKNNNELAFSVEDLGILMEPEMSIPPNKISDDEAGAAGPLDAFLKEEEDMKYEEAGFCTEQAKAFLNELDMIDWNANESRLDCSSGQAEAGNMESMELQDHELSNLIGSSELIWDNHNENEDGLASHSQLINHYVGEMEMNSSVPVAASSSWDNVFSGLY